MIAPGSRVPEAQEALHAPLDPARSEEDSSVDQTGRVRRESADVLAERLLAGDRRALARLISAVEAGRENVRETMRRLYLRTGRAHVLGLTGPPGSGKSTLTTRLALEYRRRGQTVGIVAVDPSSPYSGGALLGDRIRMMELHADSGVFMRSMATRGLMGGLARGTMDVVALLDAFGTDVVIVETVGVGQDEVEIARAAETTLVVSVPGLGDDIQAIKAGLLEIADIFVVNKADLPQSHKLVSTLRAMLSLAPRKPWHPPIMETVATTGQGIPDLVDRIAAHRAFLEKSGGRQQQRADQARRQVRAIVEERVLNRFDHLVEQEEWDERFEAIAERTTDPYAAADDALREVARGDD
jgi:LAO/AO transport system kinase